MRRLAARGVSLVELMVGSAVGLLVAAAATSVVTTSLRENRQLLVEARLMQDLRSAADLVARDLRRAGHWSAAASGVRGDDDAAPVANPHGVAADPAASDAVRLSFSPPGAGAGGGAPANLVDDAERFGFRLRAGVLEMQLGAGNWQALSDAGTLVVSSFRIEPQLDEISLAAYCDRPCAAASTTCPPRQQVRSFTVTLAARAPADAGITRTLHSKVRLRNDAVAGSCT